MTCMFRYGATIVDLDYGPEWGGQSSVELALTWEQMTDGRWRVWDRGYSRDIWSCQHTWRIPRELASDLYAIIQGAARGNAVHWLLDDGVAPFGPLIRLNGALMVRVAASQDLSMLPVNQDWTVQMQMVPDTHPIDQGNWLDYVTPTGLDAFLEVASASPSQAPAWSLQQTETNWATMTTSGDSFSASLRAILPGDKFRTALAKLVDLRGGILNIPGDRMPWGPGVAPNDAGTHRARAKAFTWSRSGDLWDLSVTVVQEPV